jgi:hypothetical protein
MQRKRVMRFIGNRPVPEPELFVDPIDYIMGPNWGEQTPKSMLLEDLREFSKTCPNPLESDFGTVDKTVVGRLYVPFPKRDAIEHFVQMTYQDLVNSLTGFFSTIPPVKKEEKPKTDPEPFEVNLTEPLVGWRRWQWSQPSMSVAPGLRSLNITKLWHPCEPMVAKCCVGMYAHSRSHERALTPFENCTCGFYAVDNLADAPSANESDVNIVAGLVYGWGRYVRGEDGWRSQFAYPKEFHLRSFQAHLIEPLKAFRVPILIDEPIRIYNPEDEGYTNEYRPNEADRDLGTSTESGTPED